VISEFATQTDESAVDTFNITSDNANVANQLDAIATRLKLKHMATPLAREIVKYGGSFLEIVCAPSGEVTRIKPMYPHTMQRNEDNFGQLEDVAFTQHDPRTWAPIAKFAAWQIVHFRYQRTFHRMYGTSVLQPVRRVYKQLQLMEDGMVIGRLYRSHVRFAVYVPVEGMSKDDAEEYIEKLRKKFKRKERYNPTTGRIEAFPTPMGASDDFWIGVRKDVQGKVDVLQGQGNLANIGDVEWFQNKLFAAIKVPKALLGFSDRGSQGGLAGTSMLTEQDVNFARTLRRLQQVLVEGIKLVLRVAALLEGLVVSDEDFDIEFPPISTVDELRNWQIEQVKATVIQLLYMQCQLVDSDYLYRKVMELDPDEITRLENWLKTKQSQAQAQQMQQQKLQMAMQTGRSAQPLGGGVGGIWQTKPTAQLPPGTMPPGVAPPSVKVGVGNAPSARPPAAEVVRHIRGLLSDDEKVLDAPISEREETVASLLVEFTDAFYGSLSEGVNGNGYRPSAN